MYLEIFARLASENPANELVYELIDQTVMRNPKAVLDAYYLASELKRSTDDVEAVLTISDSAGVLQRHEGYVCHGCGQWHPRAQIEQDPRCRECERRVNQNHAAHRYRLSDEGAAARLAATGGLGTMDWPTVPAAYKAGRVHAAIVTIKDVEEDAVHRRFKPDYPLRCGDVTYGMSRVDHAAGGKLVVANIRLTRQGNIEAARVVGRLMDDLEPKYVLLVGIGGATPYGDAVPGDVVFGNHVHDFTVALDGPDGEKEFAGRGGGMARAIVDGATFLRPTLQALATLPGAPDVDPTALRFTTENDELNAKISARMKDRFGKADDGTKKACTKVHVAPIMSSDSLIKDPRVAEAWCVTHRDSAAIDMEFAGAYDAWRDRGRDRKSMLLAVRGMSDLVGLEKVEGWVRYACDVAAEHAYQFVTRWNP